MLKFCTFTGVDESTNLKDLIELQREYPFVEWGILFSEKLAGQSVRYPETVFIHHFLRSNVNNKALHLCGSIARKIFEIDEFYFNVEDIRLQINVNNRKTPLNKSQIQNTINKLSNTKIIIQNNDANSDIVNLFKNNLFDKSGGEGKSPDNWPNYINGVFCGYAGGLGPDNIIVELPQIEKAANNNDYWIDMENNIRTNDLLDLNKCEYVLSKIKKYKESNGA